MNPNKPRPADFIAMKNSAIYLPEGWTENHWRAFEAAIDTYLEMCKILKIQPKSFSLDLLNKGQEIVPFIMDKKK